MGVTVSYGLQATSWRHPFTKETWNDGVAIFPQLVILTSTAADVAGSYLHNLGATYDKLWVVHATATNGTLAHPIPRNDAAGDTQLHIDGTNIVMTQTGAHDWTGYTIEIFLWYTLT